MPIAARLEVRGKDKSTLRSWLRASGIRAGLAQRARIVLLASEGLPNAEIARRTGTSRPTVVDWRARYVAGGVAALQDQPIGVGGEREPAAAQIDHQRVGRADVGQFAGQADQSRAGNRAAVDGRAQVFVFRRAHALHRAASDSRCVRSRLGVIIATFAQTAAFRKN